MWDQLTTYLLGSLAILIPVLSTCHILLNKDDVRAAIATLRASPFIEHDTAVGGFIYDVDTGLLNEVPALS